MGEKHAELISSNSCCSLAGICDTDVSKKYLAEQFKVPFYDNIEELLDREEPDGAVIATPNGRHVAGVEACAQRSVDVLIEKPLADTVDGADRVIQLEKETGIRVLVGHHRRHSPFIQEARSIVEEGFLGKLIAVSMFWTLLKPSDYYDVEWRRRRPGGGPALINLVHELDTMRYICGEIHQVYAQASSAARGLEVEDSLTISISFESGALGSVLASDATPSPWSYEATTHENPYYFHTDENCYYFFGTSGSLAFPQMHMWRYSDIDSSGWQYPIRRSRQVVARVDPLATQLEHFCNVIKGEEHPISDGRDGARSQAVVLAVLESIERQTPVILSTS